MNRTLKSSQDQEYSPKHQHDMVLKAKIPFPYLPACMPSCKTHCPFRGLNNAGRR